MPNKLMYKDQYIGGTGAMTGGSGVVYSEDVIYEDTNVKEAIDSLNTGLAQFSNVVDVSASSTNGTVNVSAIKVGKLCSIIGAYAPSSNISANAVIFTLPTQYAISQNQTPLVIYDSTGGTFINCMLASNGQVFTKTTITSGHSCRFYATYITA